MAGISSRDGGTEESFKKCWGYTFFLCKGTAAIRHFSADTGLGHPAGSGYLGGTRFGTSRYAHLYLLECARRGFVCRKRPELLPKLTLWGRIDGADLRPHYVQHRMYDLCEHYDKRQRDGSDRDIGIACSCQRVAGSEKRTRFEI